MSLVAKSLTLVLVWPSVAILTGLILAHYWRADRREVGADAAFDTLPDGVAGDDFTDADYHAVMCEVVELMAKDRAEHAVADLKAWELEYRAREWS